jgi:hypothetical protein
MRGRWTGIAGLPTQPKGAFAVKQKYTGWIILCGCVAATAVGVIAGRDSMPEQAQAASSQIVQQPVVSAEITRACQAVAQQIVTIQRTIVNEKRARQLRGLAVYDALVSQEYQVDTSNCPPDFRMTVLRFVTAEDSFRIHAHMDRTGKAEKIVAALVEGSR